uniref:NAD-dependent epimerase/dehydratase family protein n=1 Tax=Rheinheimera sp. TaxID=1869214 RepID=UPI004047AC89
MSQSLCFKGKRVLVAGAGGFVGTHLVQRLVDLGAKVRGTLFHKPPQRIDARVEYVRCDLTKPEDCLKVTQGIDFVFMAAANSSGAAVMEKTPLAHLTPNVVMNAHMLAAAYESRVQKFCFISSNTVYPLTDFAVKEEDTNYEYFEKYFVVGWMKRFSEIMCQMYTEKIKAPMQTVVVRPGNLYGPYDKYTWKESKVIAALIRRAVERHDPFVVWGDGHDLKDFLYIEDFIDGLLLAFERLGGFSPLNIASGQPVTVREVLTEILKATGYEDAPLQYDASQPTMIPKRLIDINRVREITGWAPQTPIREGIAKTIEWYKSTYSTHTPEELVVW